MRRLVLGLLAVAFVASGCGRTYSVAETRAALDAAGVQSLGSTIPELFPLSAETEAFPPLRLAIGELLFDEPAFRVPRYATHVGEGELLVFRGTHEAWEAEQVFALFRRQLTEDALRQVPQQDRAVGRQFAAVRTIRRGNVLIVLTGRDAQLEAVAAELP